MWPALIVALLIGLCARPSADDVPTDVLVQAFVKPDGARLRLILRVPLATLRAVDFPTRGPGYLDLSSAAPLIREAVARSLARNITLYENGAATGPPSIAAVQVSLPSDASFASYDAAAAHVTQPPLPDTTMLIWNQALADVLLDYHIRSERSQFSMDLPVGRLGVHVTTVLRFLPAAGGVRVFEFQGEPGLVRLDPRWHQAARQFVGLGFRHILAGADHLLFLFCLVIPFRRVRQLVLVITAFTVAHSITLVASALNAAPDGLWFAPLVETAIAISILYMALENILGAANVHRRWRLAFAFGLVHGFGFAFALRRSLQLAGSHLLTSLVSFNLGVELGQLFVLALFIPILQVLFRRVVTERAGTIVLSAFVAHTAWHWTIERAARLRQFDWPPADAIVADGVVRWLIGAVVLVVLFVIGRAVARGLWNRLQSPHSGIPERGHDGAAKAP